MTGGTEPTPAPIDIKGAEASDFYANCMARGGGLPPGLSRQDRDKGDQVLTWFNAMATDDEKLLLKPAKPVGMHCRARATGGVRRSACTSW